MADILCDCCGQPVWDRYPAVKEALDVLLCYAGEVRTSHVADALAISRQAANHRLNKLLEAGLAERRTETLDGGGFTALWRAVRPE